MKERLRLLLDESEPSRIRWRRADFYDAALDANMAETTRLANTIQTWWTAILVALTEQITNARTEGFNRIIKQTKRVGCGYRNLATYQRRILSDIAVPDRSDQLATPHAGQPRTARRATVHRAQAPHRATRRYPLPVSRSGR